MLRQIKTCSWDGCPNMCEGSTDHCATHNAMIRKGLREGSKVKIAVPVKKITAKHAKELADYGVLRRKYLHENSMCEVRLPGICDGMSCQVHHAAKRGKKLLDASTFVAVCESCHVFIETKMSAEERRDRGLLITKNETV